MTLVAHIVKTRCCNSVQVMGTMQQYVHCHVCHNVYLSKTKDVEFVTRYDLEVADKEGERADPILR